MSEQRRRPWRVDLDAISVLDAEGRELAVDYSVGELDGPLVVHLSASGGTPSEPAPTDVQEER